MICKNRNCKAEFEPIYHNGILVSRLCLKCLSEKGKQKLKKEWKKEKAEIKAKLKTHSEWKNELQREINHIARLIDFGQPCIATGSYNGKKNGGHFIAVGANDTIRFNLHNIHIQSEHSNTFKGGDNMRYSEGIERIYGLDYLERIRALKQTKEIKISISDYAGIIKTAKSIVSELLKANLVYLPNERIELREKYNKKIGIYGSLFEN